MPDQEDAVTASVEAAKTAKTPKQAKLTVNSIGDASTPDIRKFAESEAGLKFPEGTDRSYMIEQIFDALAWLRKDPTEGATHVVIKIGLGVDDAGMRDVRLGCNGRMMTVQREKEVEVPIAFYNVLQDINTLGYEIPPLDREGKLLSQAPGSVRIPKTKFPVQVIKFINKGS